MKFDGKRIDRCTGTVSIVRPLEDGQMEHIQIRVKQLPITWQEECELLLPQPKPPVVGKTYDKQGNESPKYNDEDPTFLEDLRQWEHRTWAKKIFDATIDERITWETERPEKVTPEFYDAVFAELLENFSRGEIAQWLLVINSIDRVGGADIALAKESLLRVVLGDAGVRAVAEPEAGRDGESVHDDVS